MKVNKTELSIDIGGIKKKYRITFDPEDNLSDDKQVARNNLVKRVYSEEESVSKWREKLFGYDVYWGYSATSKSEGYICPAMICKKDGTPTGNVLKRILRTRCNGPRLWMVLYNVGDDQIYIVKEFTEWMRRHPDADDPRDLWTNPNAVFDQKKCSE